jgi:transketolase
MSALMGVQSIHIYTHDSIGLGEDGPTHQPVEHISSLRLIPGLDVWRPCDTVESAVAWKLAIEGRDGPTALIFTRQTLAHQARTEQQIALISRGGYVLREASGETQAIIMATGSEVGLAVEAAASLDQQGIGACVVSMPNPDLFLQQDENYRNSVLPPGVSARVAVEAGISVYWRSFVGDSGTIIGVDTFGASAPGGEMFEKYGLTSERVRQAALDVIK